MLGRRERDFDLQNSPLCPLNGVPRTAQSSPSPAVTLWDLAVGTRWGYDVKPYYGTALACSDSRCYRFSRRVQGHHSTRRGLCLGLLMLNHSMVHLDCFFITASGPASDLNRNHHQRHGMEYKLRFTVTKRGCAHCASLSGVGADQALNADL
jgi:hypothetical protein